MPSALLSRCSSIIFFTIIDVVNSFGAVHGATVSKGFDAYSGTIETPLRGMAPETSQHHQSSANAS
ncbi:hypothetical protein G3480_20035 [Thiorhodococcus mannitoliphagus]|uniref:Uncharacterized protein n=1 Tax=Thiorhodococcus mannitoliphagus TaxID=329406 RepID=A0A6P1DW54_9GAMM|nr:hypothetical protein [Thiorhodococcus mannitoliphagus]NEX22567.1 hypothetical protein [Thiorhodococcus mannitoliphagus]